MQQCQWNGCDYDGHESGGQLVSRAFFCQAHFPEALMLEVQDYARQNALDTGAGLKQFARAFAQLFALPEGAPSKAGVEKRSRDMTIDYPKVHFSIDRHPAGCVMRQVWEVGLEERTAKVIEEQLVSTEFFEEGGHLSCPECKGSLDINNSRVFCLECAFVRYHEKHPKYHQSSKFRA